MEKIKKGDIVGRKSYGKDILFTVENIIRRKNEEPIAILKGLIIRIEADALISDLCLIETKQVEGDMRNFEEKIAYKINKYGNPTKKCRKILFGKNFLKRENRETENGKILHLDGDKRYSDKSEKYYKKLGLDAIVRNVPENRQEYVIFDLLNRYNPDIVVITGHDRHDKKWNRL
jgi:spore coat assembly protein